MTLIRSLDDVAPARGCVLSIGNFDGVHRGHQAMIARIVCEARRQSAPAVALTFDPHPIKLLAPSKAPPSLSTLERKSELLHRAGADFVIAVPTTRDLLGLEAVVFFERIVVEAIGAVGMIEGPNFHFGRGRGGDVELLRELCFEHGMACEILDAVADGGGDGGVGDGGVGKGGVGDGDCGGDGGGPMISSSLIRMAISDGRVDDAVSWLGHPYQIRGVVVHGDARGRTLGYPTANLAEIETLLPPDGVYAACCSIDGERYSAAVNVGGNPTFGVETKKVEAHLIGFDGDLYGQQLAVDMLARVRGVMKFESPGALLAQLKDDLVTVNGIVADRA